MRKYEEWVIRYIFASFILKKSKKQFVFVFIIYEEKYLQVISEANILKKTIKKLATRREEVSETSWNNPKEITMTLWNEYWILEKEKINIVGSKFELEDFL